MNNVSGIRWFFMTKYQKLMFRMEMAYECRARLYLPNGIILDFSYFECSNCIYADKYNTCKNILSDYYEKKVCYGCKKFEFKYEDGEINGM